MQCPVVDGSASGTSDCDALQVLATTASNDHQLRERYHRDGSESTNSSPVGIRDDKPCNVKSGSDVNSEDDESESRSSGSSGSGSGSAVFSKRTGLRKGKWTVEEEEYATRFIHYFSSGLLTLPEGKTLRASLAEKLHCDPMRITKKYAGASCLGSKISKLSEKPKYSPEDVEMAREEIARLDRRFHIRLAQGVGMPLPPDGGDTTEFTNLEMQQVYPADPSPCPPLGDASQNIDGVHIMNTANKGGASFLHLGIPDAGHPAATAMTNPPLRSTPVMSHHMTMPPAASSYLSTVADNSQIAAATIAPNITPILVTAPASALPAHVNVRHQINANLNDNIQPAAQQASSSAINWQAMFQGVNQVGVHNAATSLTAGNEQLVQTLLLQITMQLQALATLSPSALKQVQLQILAATMSAAAIPAPAVPSTPPQQAPIPWVGADAAALLAQVQLAATARQVQPVHPTGTLPAVNAVAPNHLLPLTHVPTGPLLNQYGMNALRTASTTSIPAPQNAHVHVVQSNQGSHGQERNGSSIGKSNVPPQFGTLPTAQRPRQSATTGNNMAEYLEKLKQRHAEALELEARREQAERGGRVCKQTIVCAGGETNMSSSVIGAVTKKMKQEGTQISSDIVALLPFEHATTVSSGSGCTTVDGSTSSSTENPQASDETRNDGSTSSNTASSYSEEDEDDIESVKHRSSVPLRKRFRSENNGGITRRNLEDHNFRMAAENMKNHDM